jgi:hypothetical protein
MKSQVEREGQMKREREWPYRAYRTSNLHKRRRFSANRGSSSPKQRYIPSLSELSAIKEARICRIQNLIAKDLYDTPQRQIATARRITELMLSEDREN